MHESFAVFQRNAEFSSGVPLFLASNLNNFFILIFHASVLLIPFRADETI